ncbi:TPA: hypothetical protein MY503_004875 [Escherichia coli]|uniref:hypothetical protein n=1 Tax=Proteus mirabilis TaxID=584 RepID=UPI000DE8797D|nr:hypothetical protein [Proteus mirabilis]EFJ3386269.1 hypothetical protein [Escherichia coli]HAG5565817.1 hypothetical protein [Salmonella enterica]HDJ1971270.1 hypothetical protein [Salmonella enterica subsp. enterica]EFJ3482514.1 hypothetical protein [Escherichia coli]EFP5534850.1 hypothetical protein [Escherichia coli]
MNAVILQINCIEIVSEVNEAGRIWEEARVCFEALTPLSETDTCAMITRYFDTVKDFNTLIKLTPPLSSMTGSFIIISEKNKNPVQKLKYTIPVTEELLNLILCGEYEYQNESHEQFTLAWLGDFKFIYRT